MLGAAGLVYAGVKAWLFLYPLAWLPPAAVMAAFFSFSWMHILAARWGGVGCRQQLGRACSAAGPGVRKWARRGGQRVVLAQPSHAR